MENKVEINVKVWNQNQIDTNIYKTNGNEKKTLLEMRSYDVELYVFALDLYKLMQDKKINVPEPNFSVNRSLPIYGNSHKVNQYIFEYHKYDDAYEIREVYDLPSIRNCKKTIQEPITLEELTNIANSLIPYLNKNKVWKECFKECMTYYDLKFISNKAEIGLKKIKYYIDTFNATTRAINKMVKLFNELPGKYNWYQKIAYEKKTKKYIEIDTRNICKC